MADITSEFLAYTHQFKHSLSSTYRDRFQLTQVTTNSSYFIKHACAIHFLLCQLQRSLSQLGHFTYQTTLFNNNTSKIQQLSSTVEQTIKIIQKKLDQLQAEAPNTPFTQNVVQILQQRLLNQTKDFKTHLQTRTKIIKENESKRSQLTASTEVDIIDPSIPTFLEDKQDLYSSMSFQQDQLTLLQQRSSSVEQVEKQMSEISGMIRKLAEIVHSQEQMVERIDSATDESLLNLERGKFEIEKYHSSISSNRNLTIKAFMVFVVFFVFWVVFLV